MVVGSMEMDVRWLQMQRPSAQLNSPQMLTAFQELVPPPPPMAEALEPAAMQAAPMPVENIEPLFPELVQTTPVSRHRHYWWRQWWERCPGTGLGQERLAYSLFDLEPAQPFNNLRMRTQIARGMRLPIGLKPFATHGRSRWSAIG